MNSSVTKKCFESQRVNLQVFFGFIFVACWIRTYRKIGQFFAGFFHISKRRKTSLNLNRKETLKAVKKMLTSSNLRTGVRK